MQGSQKFEKNLDDFKDFVRKKYQRHTRPFIDTVCREEFVGLRVNFQEHPYREGWIQMIVPVEEDAVTQLRQAKTLRWLEECQSWLDEFQGPWPGDDRTHFLNMLMETYDKSELSYRDIAEQINNYIVKLMRDHLKIERIEQENPDKSFFEIAELLLKQEEITDEYPLIEIREIFGFLDVKWNEQDEWLEYGFENIREGRNPTFPPGKPFDRYRVRNKINKWRKRCV